MNMTNRHNNNAMPEARCVLLRTLRFVFERNMALYAAYHARTHVNERSVRLAPDDSVKVTIHSSA